MKIIILIIFISVVCFISVKEYNKNVINYTIIGDKSLFSNTVKSVNYVDLISNYLLEEDKLGFYSKDFIYENIRVTDLLNKIKENDIQDDLSIQNILNKTNLLVINIGNNELNYKISNIDVENANDKYIYKYLDEVINDIMHLLYKIDNISKANIIFIGYYNDTVNSYNDRYYDYINSKLEKKLKKLNITYINTQKILNEKRSYLDIDKNVYITSDGNIRLYDVILSKIKEIYLQK